MITIYNTTNNIYSGNESTNIKDDKVDDINKNKNKRMEIRVTDEENKLIKDSAKKRKISVSSFLVQSALKCTTPLEENKGDIAKALVEVAQQVNYIKRYNSGYGEEIKKIEEGNLKIWHLLK